MGRGSITKEPTGIEKKGGTYPKGIQKFGPGIVAKILDGLSKGYTRKMVAEGVGVTPRTMRDWINSELPKHEGFKESVLKAEAKGRRGLVDMITFHGEKDWRAAAWLLERTRAEFSQRAKTSQEARDELDRLAVEKAQAELDHVRAKTDALNKNTLSPDQILELLDDARKASQVNPSTKH